MPELRSPSVGWGAFGGCVGREAEGRDFISTIADEGQRGQTSHQKSHNARSSVLFGHCYFQPRLCLSLSAIPPGFARFPGTSLSLAKPGKLPSGRSSWSQRGNGPTAGRSSWLAAGPWRPLAFAARGAPCSKLGTPGLVCLLPQFAACVKSERIEGYTLSILQSMVHTGSGHLVTPCFPLPLPVILSFTGIWWVRSLGQGG